MFRKVIKSLFGIIVYKIQKILTPQKIITDISEIKRLRELIKESKKNKDCYKPTGIISFYENNEEFVSLEFGLTSECPSIYIYFEGKPMTYKISYQFGMFLDYIP